MGVTNLGSSNNEGTNQRERQRWFPAFNVNPKREVPSYGICQFAHVVAPAAFEAMLNEEQPSSGPQNTVTDKYGLTHIPFDYPYGTSQSDGQGIIRVHQCTMVAPWRGLAGDDNPFWIDGDGDADGVDAERTEAPSLYHHWFNLDAPMESLMPGRVTRDFPCLALALRKEVTTGEFDAFKPGDRLTFDHNSFWLRRFNSFDTTPERGGPFDYTRNDNYQPSFKVLFTENAEYGARSYGTTERSFCLVWVEPWVPKGFVYPEGTLGSEVQVGDGGGILNP